MKEEIWKDIEGFEGYFQISNLGRVKSVKRILINSSNIKRTIKEKILSPHMSSNGYWMISLNKNRVVVKTSIHRLIAMAFINNPESKPCVNHINGIKTDNRIDNLEFVTASENIQHAYDTGLIKASAKAKFGKENPGSKKVYQFDKSGNLINTHFGVSEAGRNTNINFGHISQCALGKRKHAGGFVWKYEKV